MNFIIRLLITGAVAYGLGHFLGGIHFSDFKAALIFALVLGPVSYTHLTLPTICSV